MTRMVSIRPYYFVSKDNVKANRLHHQVWRIAQRDYKFGKGAHKTLNKATYDAVGNHFRKLWGKEAGWAHSVLFTADLRRFSDRLAASKKSKMEVDVNVKEEKDDDVEVETKVTTAVAVKRARSGSDSDEKNAKVEDEEKEVKGGADTIVHASQTTATRRMSKRLRNR